MKFSCVSCGAPRSESDNKFAPCNYCGGLPEVSLAHDRGLLNTAIKNDLKEKLEKKQGADLNFNEETSLIVLYLLDNLTILAESRVNKLLNLYPANASALLLSAVVALREKGISKSKLGTIDETVSKLNMVLALDSQEYISDVAFLVEKIELDFYRYNGIKPNTKFRGLVENLSGAVSLKDSTIAEIFAD